MKTHDAFPSKYLIACGNDALFLTNVVVGQNSPHDLTTRSVVKVKVVGDDRSPPSSVGDVVLLATTVLD